METKPQLLGVHIPSTSPYGSDKTVTMADTMETQWEGLLYSAYVCVPLKGLTVCVHLCTNMLILICWLSARQHGVWALLPCNFETCHAYIFLIFTQLSFYSTVVVSSFVYVSFPLYPVNIVCRKLNVGGRNHVCVCVYVHAFFSGCFLIVGLSSALFLWADGFLRAP